MDPIPYYPDPTDPIYPAYSTYPTYPIKPTDTANLTARTHSQCNPIVSSTPMPGPIILPWTSEIPDVIRYRIDFISRMGVRKSKFLADLNTYFQDNTVPRSPIVYQSPGLPIEVCELVIELIEDKYTLLNCCLTCWDWLPKSRVGLDRYATSSVLKLENIPTFIESHRLRPTSGRSVLSLKVELLDTDGRVPKSGASVLSLIAMQLPSRLPNLRELHLMGPDMRSIHPSSYTALTRFQKVHTLELWEPAFSTYSQLFRFVAAFRNLTSLQLRFDRWNCPTGLADGTQRILSRKPTIPHLEFGSSWGRCPALFRWLSPCATSLEINCDGSRRGDLPAIADYIRRCGGSLRDLVLGPGDEISRYKTSFEPDHFNFAHNTNLRSLRVNLTSTRDDKSSGPQDWDCDDLQSAARMLATVSSDCLEELEVSLSLNLEFDITLTHIVFLPDPGMDAIDSALALPNFPHVKRIHICMAIGYRNGPENGAVSKFSRASMVRLVPQLARRAEADLTPLDKYGSVETGLNFHVSTLSRRLEPGKHPPRAFWLPGMMKTREMSELQ